MMGRHVWAIVGLSLLLLPASQGASRADWSPNGRWLAHVHSPPRVPSRATPALVSFRPEEPPPADRTPRVGKYRLWATQVDGSSSVLLDESDGPITAPSWNPDGTAVAYAKALEQADGTWRFVVITQDGPERQRVLYSRIPVDPAAGAALAGSTVAWSPDGRHIAAPTPSGQGLLVLRAEDGRVLKTIEAARSPVWSPDGARLAFARTGREGGLWCLDQHFGPPRRITNLPDLGQGPRWTPDGLALRMIRRREMEKPAEGNPDADPDADKVEFDLVKVAVDSGRIEPLQKLLIQHWSGPAQFRSAHFSSDNEFESLFYAVPLRDQAQEILWINPRKNMVVDRFNPVDFSVPVRSLEVTPTAAKVAIRFGDDLQPGPLGLYDVATRSFLPIAPDDDSRADWLEILGETTRKFLANRATVGGATDLALSRPTLLPIPGEFEANSPTSTTLKRLARLAVPLCVEGSADKGRAALDQTRTIFHYLAGEYPAALDSLRSVERSAASPDQRLRLLGLRAQILIAMGDQARATPLLEFLQGAVPAGRLRLEEGPDGSRVLVPEPSPAEGWLGRLVTAARSMGAKDEADPEIGNFDNPNDVFELPDAREPAPRRGGFDDFPVAPRPVIVPLEDEPVRVPR